MKQAAGERERGFLFLFLYGELYEYSINRKTNPGDYCHVLPTLLCISDQVLIHF